MTDPADVVLLDHTVLTTTADTERLGSALARRLHAGDVVVLVGELGAGKTTLTRGLADGLGVRGPVTSPTFVISRVHPSLRDGPALVHVDAYRLGDAAEVDDIDLDETVGTSVTVVEWGAGVAEQLSDSFVAVDLVRRVGGEAAGVGGDPGDDMSEESEDPRDVRVVGHGPRWAGEPPLEF